MKANAVNVYSPPDNVLTSRSFNIMLISSY